jgi:hypothetical protein
MAAKLTLPEVRKFFEEYDGLVDIRAARSAILEKIAKGYGEGPFEQGDARFKIVQRKHNNTDEIRYLLRMLDSESAPTKL